MVIFGWWHCFLVPLSFLISHIFRFPIKRICYIHNGNTLSLFENSDSPLSLPLSHHHSFPMFSLLFQAAQIPRSLTKIAAWQTCLTPPPTSFWSKLPSKASVPTLVKATYPPTPHLPQQFMRAEKKQMQTHWAHFTFMAVILKCHNTV